MDPPRIMGLETDWALIVTEKGGKPIEGFFYTQAKKDWFVDCIPSPPRISLPDASGGKYPCQFLSNGARAGFDGMVFEYGTPEAVGPRRLLIYEKAGEAVVAAAVKNITQELRDGDLVVRSYKTNLDSTGSSLGAHENYLVRRHPRTELKELIWLLVPFLISRVLFTGNGWVYKEGGKIRYRLSQRSSVVEHILEGGAMSDRPLLQERSDVHAHHKNFMRLHLLLGDSNMAHTATFLKFGTTKIVLDMIEDGFLHEPPCGTEHPSVLVLALNKFSEDPTLRCMVEWRGQKYTALNIQEIYAGLAHRFFEKEKDPSEEDLNVLALWDEVLRLARSSMPHEALSALVDWAAKQCVLERDMSRHGYGWGSDICSSVSVQSGMRRITLDALSRAKYLDYHYAWNNVRGGAKRLEARGFLRKLVDEREVTPAILDPFPDTRAYARSRQLLYVKSRVSPQNPVVKGKFDWEEVVVTLADGTHLSFFTDNPHKADPCLP